MNLNRAALAGFLIVSGATLSAQRPAIAVDDDDITIRGCLTAPGAATGAAPMALVWTRSDIMLAAAEAPESALGSADLASRVFYWLDDGDNDDLARHVGKRVEIKGELDDLEKGKIQIDRDGDYTKLELDLDGKKEKARVPTAWLRGVGGDDDDKEFDIAARRVDVKDIKVLGSCR